MRRRFQRCLPTLTLTVLVYVVSILGITVKAQTDPPFGGTEFAILSPTDGQNYFTNTSGDLIARFKPLAVDPSIRITVTAKSSEGKHKFLIGDGELAVAPGSDRIELTWDTSEVPPGSYVVYFTARAEGHVLTNSVKVNVLDPPTVDAALIELRGVGEVFEATFVAYAEPSVGAELVRYLWRAEDTEPIEATEPTVTIKLTGPGTNKSIVLDVFDSAGGQARLVKTIFLPTEILGTFIDPESYFAMMPLAFCGCQSMVVGINPANRTGIFCAPNVAAIPAPNCARRQLAPAPGIAGPAAPNPCPGGKIPYTCALGPQDPGVGAAATGGTAGFNFEVIATLVAGSIPALCREGQVAQGDVSVNNARLPNQAAEDVPAGPVINLPRVNQGNRRVRVVSNPIGTPPARQAPYPRAGAANWGADKYAVQDRVKIHDAAAIRWVDLPGGPVAGGTNRIDDNRSYLPFVGTRTHGYCWCEININQTWRRATGLGGRGARRMDGFNCRVN